MKNVKVRSQVLPASCARGAPIPQGTRRGVILIFVIVILVLVALIGTAYVTTARVDRYTARQNSENTQIDLLLESVVNIATANITRDVYDSDGLYRSRDNETYFDTDATAGDLFMADRAPEQASDGMIIWKNLTWPMLQSAGTDSPKIDTPYIPSGAAGVTLTSRLAKALAQPYVAGTWLSGQVVRFTPASTGVPGYYVCKVASTTNPPTSASDWDLIPAKGNYRFAPTSLTISSGTYPALTRRNLLTSEEATFLAADADGDGIADSTLWRVPVAENDGVTYYAAVRIVDQNSAINANTAWSATSDFTGASTFAAPVATDALGGTAPTGGRTNLGLYPSHVGLAEMVTPAEMTALNTYRFGSANPPAGVVGASSVNPIDDTNTARTDFQFNTQAEALWMQLGRRIDNPGYARPGVKCQSMGLSDTLSLANDFVVRPTSLTSTVESKLQASLYTNARTTSYGASDVTTWFNEYFPSSGAPTRGYRPHITTFNPVSNVMPFYALSTAIGNWTSTDPLGKIIKFTTNGKYYLSTGVDDNGNCAYAPLLNYSGKKNLSPYRVQISSARPARVSVNSADFETLVAGFALMMGRPGAPGAITSSSSVSRLGNTPFGTTVTSIANPFGTTNTHRMFRSPIRRIGQDGSTYAFLDPTQMLYIRAMLAALNTIDMIDADDDVTSIHIPANIGNWNGGKNYSFTLNGAEKQPFITEVFVSGNAASGYASIELYNPYSAPLVLNNYRLLTRNTSSSNGVDFPYPPITATIPANGYLILQNGATPPAEANRQLPSATCVHYPALTSPNLRTEIALKEVYLVRPHRADGTLIPSGYFEESTNDKRFGWVPVDQFDFSELTATGSNWLIHYCRASGIGNEWKCVYRGPILTTGKQAGLQSQSYVAFPVLTCAAKVGGADPLASWAPTYPTFAIQIANHNGGSANPVTAATGNRAPYGGFARVGDLQQIPFIGSYHIAKYQNNGNANLANSNSFVECNSITMDAAFADDADGGADDAYEPFGRFLPMRQIQGYTGSTDHYSWADIGNYFSTITDPSEDHLPNLNAEPFVDDKPYLKGERMIHSVAGINSGAPTLFTCINAVPSGGYSAAYFTALFKAPGAVANSVGITANDGNEDPAPIQGLININTAPWRVLAAVPWTSNATWNTNIAKSIVYARNIATVGTFQSIFDLNKVQIYNFATGSPVAFTPVCMFSDAWWTAAGLTSTTAAAKEDGDLSDVGYSPASAGATSSTDLERVNLGVTRVSNLITTRSDAYMCYVVLEGWTGAGTSSAALTSRRRAAFLVDRSRLNQVTKVPRVYRTSVE